MRTQADTGIDRPVGASVLWQTCAMWMKIGRFTAHKAANFLGNSIEVMEGHYGTWDPLSMYAAITALTGAKTMKEATKRAKAEGIPF